MYWLVFAPQLHILQALLPIFCADFRLTVLTSSEHLFSPRYEGLEW